MENNGAVMARLIQYLDSKDEKTKEIRQSTVNEFSPRRDSLKND